MDQGFFELVAMIAGKLPPEKRAKTSFGHDFSLATDLTIVIEDQRVEVHSLILMMVSPVFRQMLAVDMGERTKREINLASKKKGI